MSTHQHAHAEAVISANAYRRLAKRRDGLEYLQAAAGQLLAEHSGTSGAVTPPAADALAEAVARTYACSLLSRRLT